MCIKYTLYIFTKKTIMRNLKTRLLALTIMSTAMFSCNKNDDKLTKAEYDTYQACSDYSIENGNFVELKYDSVRVYDGFISIELFESNGDFKRLSIIRSSEDKTIFKLIGANGDVVDRIRLDIAVPTPNNPYTRFMNLHSFDENGNLKLTTNFWRK